MTRYRAALAALAAVALLLAAEARDVPPTLSEPSRLLQAIPNISCSDFITTLKPDTPITGCDLVVVPLSSLVNSPAATTHLTADCADQFDDVVTLNPGANCTYTAEDTDTGESCQGSILVFPCTPACRLPGLVINVTSPKCEVTAAELGKVAFAYVSPEAQIKVYLVPDLDNPMGTKDKNKSIDVPGALPPGLYTIAARAVYGDVETQLSDKCTAHIADVSPRPAWGVVCMALTHRNAQQGLAEVDGIADAPAGTCTSAFVWAREAGKKKANGAIKRRNWIYINDVNFELTPIKVGSDNYTVSSFPTICIDRRRIKRRGTTVAFKIGAADRNGYLDPPGADVSGEVTIHREDKGGCKLAFDSLF
ncbi:hypothetical protein Rsub_02660 [Raphidocelis subcapitata]|uniref:Uncharacterized protein n=1 Tax=Raphidocelis subcapitata TaxID=307507 RepID=A0A2V0NQN5_9CHLO|nr:hypothetical protein Rsub_02660 [Raphidocelis subcapitata]|eukprot:GBF89956.1 hypothetical protein Rsub_02660 [Raphidocelis subcapitata]